MNVQRSFQPRLFEILNIPPKSLSKIGLSNEVQQWMKVHGCLQNSFPIDAALSELTGLPEGSEYTILGSGFWDFITLIYKKWIIRGAAGPL